MRYGVLHDVAQKVLSDRDIDLTAGHCNVIWQGDANAMVLRALGHCTAPTQPLNVSGPETVSIRALAEAFGRSASASCRASPGPKRRWVGWQIRQLRIGLFGYPAVPLARMIDWVADWVSRGHASLGKETHYDSRDGSF